MIRKYKETDIEALLDVWYKATVVAHPFLGNAFLQKEKKKIREVYIPITETWVFQNEDGLDGFISMMGNEVGAIFVRPEKHGQGIGRKLMDFVHQFHKTLEVEVFKDNKIGRTFYDKYGFKIIKESIHEETQQDLLRMRLDS
ncbi:N-acetyltransferase [Fulvivirgaceae bacterium BMA10]|uniref:N-acetyltransferase n=1 Tax=Splendidivirga corallicola TaxID=3051826 RepID=A0ABT8KMX5_9BACT|nr:N-acetyltransferase [Fulvivirgaceae bacterium BMA10]